MAISHDIPQPSITELSLQITYVNFHSNHPGANELINHHILIILYQSIIYVLNCLKKDKEATYISVSIMTADALVMQGARALAGIILT